MPIILGQHKPSYARDKINWTALYVSVRTGLMSLMTSHPGAKRLGSIQAGLMVSLSRRLE